MTKRILVVEDDVKLSSLLKSFLAAAGYDVEVAAGGREATQRVEKSSFDVVVTDIVMPDGDGLQLIMDLKKTRPNTKILAITGHLQSPYVESARGLGAHAVLEKPFILETLVLEIRSLTEGNGEPAVDAAD